MNDFQFYNIDGVEIPFNKDWNSIAISVSGGADSALLTFILCDLISKNDALTTVNIINHIRMWKTKPWQQYNSTQVFKYIKNRFPNITFKQHTNFIAPELEHGNIGPSLTDEYGKSVSGDNIEQRAFAEFICHVENCDAYFNAVTRNPENYNFGGMQERNIKRTAENEHLEIKRHMGKWALHPFRFVEKDWVIRQYQRYNILDLFNITRSCEGVFSNIDYTNYVSGQYVPTCEECFWCKERAWALSQLGNTL